MGSSASSPRLVYAYVPRDQLASIMQHGYLSARAQVERKLNLPELRFKYGEQLAAALGRRDFVGFLGRNRGKYAKYGVDAELVAYLDWRDEKTERGADAIYWLFAPIPESAKAGMDEFLKDRVLISWECLTWRSARVVAGVGRNGAEYYFDKPPQFWGWAWRRALEKEGRLWFEDIPHAYTLDKVVPPGKIVPLEVNLDY